MNFRFQANPAHSNRILHAILIIDDELLRNHVNDFAIKRDRNRLCGIYHPIDIGRTDFPVFDGNYTMTVDSLDMATAYPGKCAGYFAPGHKLGLLDRLLDR
ncbi:MAG: hypothetical protein BWY40_01109 [bacterium ADurb.Bin270]|nr:MAG: hypothetical protein BWY40_01109 [bacterium ADurb.Bin270]